MKNLYILILFIAAFVTSNAQSPSSINYQAVLRDGNGALIKSQSVSLKLSILKGSASGSAVYSETHSTSTNEFGMVSLQIGNGSTSNDFKDINWGENAHYLKVELDEKGGSSYKNLGTSELVSVPYAMFANKALNVVNGDKDSTNELQTISLSGNKVSLSKNGGSFDLPDLGKGYDKDSTNELQTISLKGDKLTLSGNGGTVTLPSTGKVYDKDKDSLNELQTLSLSGSKLTLSNGGGTVTLPSASNYWTKSGDSLSFNKYVRIGNSVGVTAPRLVVGATAGNNSRIGLHTLASGGTTLNYGIKSEVYAAVRGSANNSAVNAYANTGKFSASAFKGVVEGDSIGFGASIEVKTRAANVGYSANLTSTTGTGFSQYGANLIAEGGGRGNHYGIRAYGLGTGTSTASGSANYGAVLMAGGTGKNFGIGALTQTISEHYINIGTYAVSNGAASTGYNYGVIGSANSADTNYAGYFFGDVTYTGSLSGPSDAKLKTNVENLENDGAINRIMSLRPVTYNYKRDDYEFMNLPSGRQYGFIAQELDAVFPELVNTQVTPVFEHSENTSTDPDGKSEIEKAELFRYQGVNYIGLIPILTQGIQEQQSEIEVMKTEIELLKQQNEELKALVKALLEKQ